MAVNLLTHLSDQFTPSVIDQLGQRFGESPANLNTAVKAIIPTVLGGLAQRTHRLSDAEEIVDFLRHVTYTKTGTPLDISQVSNTAAETQDAIAAGSSFIERILPTQVEKVAIDIARHSQINRTSALGVMDLVGAQLENLLGRQSLDNGMTGLNLSTLVGGQVADIRAGIPAGMAGLATSLGFDKLGGPDTGGEGQGVTTFTSTPVNPDIPKSPLVERERENINWLRWAMIAVGALILFLIIQKCRQPQTGTDGVYTDTTARAEPDSQEDTSATARANAAESNGSPTGSIPGGPAGAAAREEEKRQLDLPGGRRIRVGANTFNANLAGFLAGKTRPLPRTFTFENLTFETNTTKITPETQPNVNDLIEIMNAYPTLQINIQGHTDNTGDAVANKKLSLDRANAIRSVLSSAGVASNRVTTQGFGAEKPTATNDTEEGRQKNRRIDVVVTKV